MVVSPDVGGVARARDLAQRIDAPLSIKEEPKPNESEVMNIIGDVAGKCCIVPDDMIDTAGTLCNAAGALKDFGAIKVVAYCTHPVLSGNAIKNIENSRLDELVVTEAKACNKIFQLSLDRLLAESIRRVSNEESISAMFR